MSFGKRTSGGDFHDVAPKSHKSLGRCLACTDHCCCQCGLSFFFFNSTSTPTSATTTKMSTSPAPPTKRVRHVAPLQRTLSQLDSERAVGITEYLNPEAPGWKGVLKQRFVSLFPEKGAGRTTREQEGLIGVYGKVYRLLGE